MTSFRAIQVSERVYWVGAIDWSIRDFHGYSTSRGTTYNAFLIMADHITLIDTVKPPFYHEMMSRIQSVIEPDRIDYIVSNHSELDHSGCLPQTIAAVKPKKVYASKLGVKTLNAHFSNPLDISAVQNNETISLGNGSLTFWETKMLHWPESMVSYFHEDQVLFSQDAFGMHLATSERFVDQLDFSIVRYETAKYFANILLPFLPRALKIITFLRERNISINLIANDHGPLWRGAQTEQVLTLYDQWTERKPTNKVLIVYDTMWRSTSLMAQAIAEGVLSAGYYPRVISIGGSHRSDIATELIDASGLIVGSPTLNNNIFPSVVDVITYLKGLKPINLAGAAFGSYGWSGEAVKHLTHILTEMKVNVVSDGIRVKYVPKSEDLKACFELGKKVAEAIEPLAE